MEKSSLIYAIKVISMVLVASYVIDKLAYKSLSLLNERVFTGQSGGKVNQFLKEKDNMGFIVFGSSRANHHINCKLISENSFNMGLDGSQIAFSATLIKTLPKNKKQTVLLHIGSSNSYNDDYIGEDLKSLNRLYHDNDIIKNEIDLLNTNNVMQDLFWCLNYNGIILGLVKNYFSPNYDYKTYSGYDPLHVTQEEQKVFEHILSQTKKKNCKQNLSLNPVYKKYIGEIKEFCQANNKKLILFTAPIYQDDCKNDDKALTAILNKEGITYWNFTDFFKDDQALENWKDNTHLSNIGAEKFTEEIKRKLME